jgi:hypothetical protein
VREHEWGSTKLNMWCGLTSARVVGPNSDRCCVPWHAR